jgi:hypothetical protein
MPNAFPSIRSRSILAFCLLAASLAPLRAQTAPATTGNTGAAAPADNSNPRLNLVMEGVYEHIFSADLKNGGSGSMSANRFVVGLQHWHDRGDDNHFRYELGYAYTNYDFGGTSAPFGNVQKLGASILYTHDFNPEWGGFAFVSGGYSAETATSLSKGGQLAIAAGPAYNFSKTLTVSAGPMFYSRLEDSDTWTPYAKADWKFLPQWELIGYAGTSNGVKVIYDVFGNPATVVDASLNYNSHWFRTRDVPAGKQAVNESYADFTLGVRQALSQNFFVRGYATYLFSREYQFHVAGNAANSFDVKPAVGLGLEIGAAF